MKATDLLVKQHRQVKSALKKLPAAKGREASSLLVEIANALSAHMAIEQQIFYPAARAADEDMVIESFEEHSIAELALKRLLATSPSDPTFSARAKVLKELVEHHIEEEESDLFPNVEKTLGDAELQRLGKEMKASFDAAVERGYEAAIPKGSRTSADAAERRVLAASNGGAPAAR